MPDRTRPPAAQTFLEHRRRQENIHEGKAKWSKDPMASLISVELNVMDACNRDCHFCPHSNPKVYPNEYGWRMTTGTAQVLARDLMSFNYQGRISMSGYGEPMLSMDVYQIIHTFRQYLPQNTIEMNTNGDPLTINNIRRVFAAGLTQMYVNMYDGKEQAEQFIKLFREAGEHNYVMRPHYDKADSYGLIINNRSGIVRPKKEPLEKRCHYPFYKMFVDWDGSVQFCANDWGRNIPIGNIHNRGVEQIWMSDQMEEIRKRLAKGDRSMHPCSTCNVDGTLHGEFSFKRLMEFYDE